MEDVVSSSGLARRTRRGKERCEERRVDARFIPGIHRWSQGLLFHQAMVDCARAAILLPLGSSILNCQPVNKCSLVETAFLLLVTVSTVNMLTTVLNDSPVFPESDEEADLTAPLLMDSPQVRELAVRNCQAVEEPCRLKLPIKHLPRGYPRDQSCGAFVFTLR